MDGLVWATNLTLKSRLWLSCDSTDVEQTVQNMVAGHIQINRYAWIHIYAYIGAAI